MEYVNDINIQEAVIHILDSNSEEPILNEYTLELNEDIYKFLYRHMEKCLKDEELKTAVFNPERNIVKEIVQDYLNGIDKDIVSFIENTLFTTLTNVNFDADVHVEMLKQSQKIKEVLRKRVGKIKNDTEHATYNLSSY